MNFKNKEDRATILWHNTIRKILNDKFTLSQERNITAAIRYEIAALEKELEQFRKANYGMGAVMRENAEQKNAIRLLTKELKERLGE
jgi:hypothetical protein